MPGTQKTPTDFAHNLRQRRKECGWTQKKLADMVGVTTQTISEYERATVGDHKGKKPTLDNAIAIAKALSVSLDSLCGTEPISEKRFGDIAREMIYMLSVNGIEYAEYPMPDEGTEGKFPSEKYKRIEYRYAHCPALIVTDSQLKTFLSQWHQLVPLLQEGALSREIYEDWIANKFEKLNRHTAISNGITDPYVIPDIDEEAMEAREEIKGKPDF